jgi:hypothetical protein
VRRIAANSAWTKVRMRETTLAILLLLSLVGHAATANAGSTKDFSLATGGTQPENHFIPIKTLPKN